MNYIDILKKLDCWKQREHLLVAPLKGGMNNRNFLIHDGTKKYVAHFAPAIHKMFWLDREREMRNYKIASSLKLSADVFRYYKKYRLLIIDYLEGNILTKKKLRDPKTIKKIARALKKLHAGPRFSGSIWQKDRAMHYLRAVKHRKGWLPRDMASKMEKLKGIEAKISPLRKSVPCHLDLMLENIILTPDKKIKFIDWEYSSNGDYRYDLAMLSIQGEYGEKIDNFLIKEYDGKTNPELLKDMRLMKAVVCFAEAAYGVFQNTLSRRKDIDYRSYAISEYKKFEQIVHNELNKKIKGVLG